MLSMHFLMKARNTAWSNDQLYRATTDLIEAGTAPGVLQPLQAVLTDMQSLDGTIVPALETAGTPFAPIEAPSAGQEFLGLAKAQADLDRRLIRVCEGMDDDRLLSRVVVVHRGRPGKEAVHAVLAHLFTLQAHFRGIACARLADAGGRPPTLDGYFLQADRDARAADLARLGLDHDGGEPL